jgi:hypothetical protein
MGFRYSTPCLELFAVWSYQNTLSFSIQPECLTIDLCINGSNVNDYPPSDTLELSSDHLIEVWLIILLLYMVDDHPIFCHPSHYCFAHSLSFLQNKPLPLKYVKFQNVRRYAHFHDIYVFFFSHFCFLLSLFLMAFCFFFQSDYIYWGQPKWKWCLKNSQDCSLWNNVSFSFTCLLS